MEKPQRMADCHPDRPHMAKGLCSACYQAACKDKLNPGRHKFRPPGSKADCHPTRPHHCRGLCKQCYARFHNHGQAALDVYNSTENCDACGRLFLDMPDREKHNDHDHASDVPLGILCNACNTARGSLRNDVETILKLAQYQDRCNRKTLQTRKT